mmetsp:Transcript_17744/g.35663  ORF Transcript_17744/g.35663 Transcript_17744/m.35663 type:complete len:302 (-) Transcript_17744:517-1422(-)
MSHFSLGLCFRPGLGLRLCCAVFGWCRSRCARSRKVREEGERDGEGGRAAAGEGLGAGERDEAGRAVGAHAVDEAAGGGRGLGRGVEAAEEDGEEDEAQTEHVRRRGRGLPALLLRGQPVRRARHGGGGGGAEGCFLLGEAEVDELGGAGGVDHDVARLDVAVHDGHRVQVRDAFRNPRAQRPQIRLAQPRPRKPHVIVQRPHQHLRHKRIQHLPVLILPVLSDRARKRHHVLVVQLEHDVSFPAEALPHLRVLAHQLGPRRFLHRNFHAIVCRFEHHPEAPGAKYDRSPPGRAVLQLVAA